MVEWCLFSWLLKIKTLRKVLVSGHILNFEEEKKKMGYETTNSSRPGIKRKLKTLGLGLETENFLDVCD